jgi:hypothetical protein
MAKQPKLPKRLFKNKDIVHARQQERETKTSMKHMTRDHVDVLQNIEFTLVSCSRRDRSIDDRMVAAALEAALRPSDADVDMAPQVEMMCELLQGMRETREDVSDEIWRAGLRTVRDSVHRHSGLRPGEKAYLQFVSPYVR